MSTPPNARRATALDLAAGKLLSPRFFVDPDTTRDLRGDVLGDDGRMKVLPTSFWKETTADERGLFGNRTGLYSYPTVELVEHLAAFIGARGPDSAIEIGAGHGVLADALGIVGTDSMQQADPHYRDMYLANGYVPVPYGPNVKKADARSAVREWKPRVVIASWVTWKFDPARPGNGGNEVGVHWPDVLRHCEELVFIGNTNVHAEMPILKRRHAIQHPPYLFSRAMNGSPDFIAIWKGSARAR